MTVNGLNKDLLLLGGGHTHVLLIKALAMRPISGVRVTLLSEKPLTPYSGMLPGFVAGHYSLEQTNIDLNQLCRKAGVRWICARCSGVDARGKRAHLIDLPDVEFDVLSIDIGSTPDQRILGADKFSVGVKPIAGFQRRWDSLLQALDPSENKVPKTDPVNWGVIGAGAGGVELVLAMAYRLRAKTELTFHLIYRGERILSGYPNRVIEHVEQSLKEYGVTLHSNFSVTEVTPTGVINDSGNTLELDERIWCTGALGASWLKKSGLALNAKNFIQVGRTLQSTSHEHIFAVGDIAEMVDDPRPKAGVFAVRQAPYLENNLRRFFTGKPLQDVKLQKDFLSLLALGDKVAVASRNGLALKGRWAWRWKDAIDQKFMRQFSELPMIMHDAAPTFTNKKADVMQCGGCASKLGPKLLTSNLNKLSDNGAFEIEDAVLWKPTPGALGVQSIDGFRSFMSDEFNFARVCVNHALNDLYAMGARAMHIQAWINLAFSSPVLQQRDHLRTLLGIQAALVHSQASLSGGHSSAGVESHLGITVNGEVSPGEQWTKSNAKPGDLIVLNKALGTGVVMAADMQGEASADAVEACYESMLLSNHHAIQSLRKLSPSAVTDVSGFGLIGHLLEMLDSANEKSTSTIIAELDLTSIPLLAGALDLAKAGWRSSLYPQLESYLLRCSFANEKNVTLSANQRRPVVELLLDPQTSGGLLATMSESEVSALLKNKGGSSSEQKNSFTIIGNIKEKTENTPKQISIQL